MVAGRPSPAPLGPVYPAGSALGGGWGLLWPYGSRVFRWCLDAVWCSSLHSKVIATPARPAAFPARRPASAYNIMHFTSGGGEKKKKKTPPRWVGAFLGALR